MEEEISDLREALNNTAEPLVIVLGAGASRSSGGPTTEQVHEALAGAAARIGTDQLRERLHEVNAADKRAALGPLFADASPYLGYRCIAALGRTRRVIVLNLNWDNLVIDACARLDVPAINYDLHDAVDWDLMAKLPPDAGVVVVHLHGRLTGQARYGRLETPQFTDEECEHVRDLVHGHRTVVLGVSLTEDEDVVALLEQIDDGNPGRLWGFFRGDTTGPAADAGRLATRLGATRPVFMQSFDVDFDRIMLLVTDGVIGTPWYESQRLVPQLALPPLDEMVLPNPDLARRGLDDQAIVFLGPPQNGKTTLSCLFGHLLRVWHEPDGALRYFEDPSACLSALSAPLHVAARDVFVLDSPFGDEPDGVDSVFVKRLHRWLQRADTPRLVIASRVSGWSPRVPASPPSTFVSSASPRDWYRLDDLKRFAERLETPGADLVRRVHPDELDTPARIRDAKGGLRVASSSSDDKRKSEAISERARVLTHNPQLAKVCSLVRLQEFGGTPTDATTLERVAGLRAQTSQAELMLTRYEWEGQQQLRLSHPFDRDATDRWLDSHLDDMAQLIGDAGTPATLGSGWEAWNLLRSVRDNDWDAVRAAPRTTVADAAAQIVETARNADALAVASECPMDEWAAADLAYALVQTWDSLPSVERRNLLDELLANADVLGAYAVLEACLYLQETAPREVLIAVQNRLYELDQSVESTWQTALAIDGLAWRTPTEPDWAIEWAHAQLGRREGLLGVLPVIAAYHLGGAEALGFQAKISKNSKSSLAPAELELAARLVRWHFLHQSRARAQIVRQHWVDKAYLCRTLHPEPAGDENEGLLWLLSALNEAGAPGWTTHAALFAVGALGLALGPAAVEVLHTAFDSAPPNDIGVVAANATYPEQSIRVLGRDRVHRRYENQVCSDVLLDGAANGVIVDDVAVTPPRFSFVDRGGRLAAILGIRYGRLVAAGMTVDPPTWGREARSVLPEAVAAGRADVTNVRVLTQRLENGDLRDLDDAVAAAGAGAPAMADILERAAEALDLR